MVRKNDDEVVVADIPGLLAGAHKGNGLGFQFLKHVERCKSIIHMIDISSKDLLEQYDTICEELEKYDKSIQNKKKLVLLNKCDLISEEKINEIKLIFKKKLNHKVYVISTISGYGIKEVIKEILNIGKQK